MVMYSVSTYLKKQISENPKNTLATTQNTLATAYCIYTLKNNNNTLATTQKNLSTTQLQT